MFNFLRVLIRNLPSFLLALIMAVAVWVVSITQADPNIKQVLSRPISVDLVGQDPGTIITSVTPRTVSVTINAPQSIWNRLNSEDNLISASADLAGLGPGAHIVRVQAVPRIRPANLIATSPQNINITLEKLSTQALNVHLVPIGEPAIGYQAGTPILSAGTVSVSGPESVVKKVAEVRAPVDETQAHDNIDRTVTLQPLDSGGNPVSGVTLSPDRVTVQIPITQRFGFRTVSVKVVVTGQVASGYRVTNISVFPLAVTVSSSDPQLVNDLPGFVETTPVDLDGIKNALDVQVGLNLPTGIRVEGDQSVLVQVGIAAIESNLTLKNLTIQPNNLFPGLAAQFSPETLDLILSGPLPELDALTTDDIKITVDLTGKGLGSFQATPTVQVSQSDLRIVSILPATVQVSVIVAPTPTPTRRP